MSSVRGISGATSSFAAGRGGVGGCRADASTGFGVPYDGGDLGGPGGSRPGCGVPEGAGRLFRNACTIGLGFSTGGIRVTVEPSTFWTCAKNLWPVSFPLC